MLIRLFDGAVTQLQQGLAFSARRHAALTENLANVDTPGYRARDLVFEDQMAGQTAASDSAPVADPAAPRLPGSLVYSGDGAPGANGNDVLVDRQMARLAENTLFHHALVQILAGQFNTLKQAISGRV